MSKHRTENLAKSKTAKLFADKKSLELRAYQIHQEKGGSQIDNWLEAEQTLTNNIN